MPSLFKPTTADWNEVARRVNLRMNRDDLSSAYCRRLYTGNCVSAKVLAEIVKVFAEDKAEQIEAQKAKCGELATQAQKEA
jgi:hypothetical protein